MSNTVPCKICGQSGFAGTGRCDPCWEVTHRIYDFLRRGETKAAKYLLKEILKYRVKQNYKEDIVAWQIGDTIDSFEFEETI